MVESKLAALEAYQLSLASPAPPAGSFDAAAASRGHAVFAGAGQCAGCHVGLTLTDADTRLHQPSEIPTDPTHAERSATKMYRTTPLRALWQHAPYFHDGSAATLKDVVQRYDQAFGLDLSPAEMADLVEYLKSL